MVKGYCALSSYASSDKTENSTLTRFLLEVVKIIHELSLIAFKELWGICLQSDSRSVFYYSQNGDSTVKHWDAEAKYAEWSAKSGWKASSLLSWNSHVLILSCCSYQKTLTNSITWITPDGCVIHTKLWGLSLLSYKNMWRHRSQRIEITVPWNDLCERKSKSLVNEHQRPAALWRRTDCR